MWSNRALQSNRTLLHQWKQNHFLGWIDQRWRTITMVFSSQVGLEKIPILLRKKPIILVYKFLWKLKWRCWIKLLFWRWYWIDILEILLLNEENELFLMVFRLWYFPWLWFYSWFFPWFLTLILFFRVFFSYFSKNCVKRKNNLKKVPSTVFNNFSIFLNNFSILLTILWLFKTLHRRPTQPIMRVYIFGWNSKVKPN